MNAVDLSMKAAVPPPGELKEVVGAPFLGFMVGSMQVNIIACILAITSLLEQIIRRHYAPSIPVLLELRPRSKNQKADGKCLTSIAPSVEQCLTWPPDCSSLANSFLKVALLRKLTDLPIAC